MISLMLVAGSSTQSLKNFLEERGSLEVVYTFDNLYGNADELRSGIFRADKLVYVDQDNSTSVRRDMQVLLELLAGGNFFTVQEIIYFRAGSDDNFFESVINEVSLRANDNRSIVVPQHGIIKSAKNFSYDQIYSGLLGVTEELRVNNKFDTVLRVKRGSKVKSAYEQENTEDLKLEPFTFRNLREFNRTVDSIIKTDSGEIIIDSEPESPIIYEDLGELPINKLRDFPILLFSGNRGNGVSTICSAVTVSLSNIKERILVLDLSVNNGIVEILKTNNVPVTLLETRDCLLERVSVMKSGINVLSGIRENSKVLLVRNILANLSKYDFDALVVDCSKEYFEDVVGLFETLSPMVFIVTHPFESKVLEVSQMFENIKTADLVVNNPLYDMLSPESLEAKEIRKRIRNIHRLFSRPMLFNNLALDEYLASQFLGV